MTARKTSFTYKLSTPEQAALMEILRRGNYRPVQVEHATVAGETEDCRIVLYKSGKCLIQGKGASDFVLFTLEPVILGRAQHGYEEILDPTLTQARVGVDESGKGDYWGPLVVVGAYVDSSLLRPMQDMDVKDSKNISSDKKALEMGRNLRKLLGKRYSIVKIGPRAYNRLYARMRNVNSILAWAHARAIENMLETIPDCPRAISDQFGNKRQVEQALMKKGRKIELIQKHQAESDMAVAAASVIARETFLRSLADMEKKYNCSFAKGASEKVKEGAVKFLENRDPTILLETAKCHFKTTDAVLEQAGKDRKALGPEGQAVSKPHEYRGKKPAKDRDIEG
jgi:ribonuclease HIII